MATSTPSFPSEACESLQADSPSASRTSFLSDIEKQEQLDSHSSQECNIGAPLKISPSHLSQPSSPGIPDGGVTAWLQVLCGFFLFFNSWSVTLPTRRTKQHANLSSWQGIDQLIWCLPGLLQFRTAPRRFSFRRFLDWLGRSFHALLHHDLRWPTG